MRSPLRSAACGLTVVLLVAMLTHVGPPAPRLLAEDTTPPAPERLSKGHRLYGAHCVGCHGSDGAARRARESTPEIPDFTKPEWHARKTNAHLAAAILDGKGNSMP